jgi:hypothetical protein
MSNATELLRRAEECLRHAEYPNDYREEESDELRDDIIAYLNAQKSEEKIDLRSYNRKYFESRFGFKDQVTLDTLVDFYSPEERGE